MYSVDVTSLAMVNLSFSVLAVTGRSIGETSSIGIS